MPTRKKKQTSAEAPPKVKPRLVLYCSIVKEGEGWQAKRGDELLVEGNTSGLVRLSADTAKDPPFGTLSGWHTTRVTRGDTTWSLDGGVEVDDLRWIAPLSEVHVVSPNWASLPTAHTGVVVRVEGDDCVVALEDGTVVGASLVPSATGTYVAPWGWVYARKVPDATATVRPLTLADVFKPTNSLADWLRTAKQPKAAKQHAQKWGLNRATRSAVRRTADNNVDFATGRGQDLVRLLNDELTAVVVFLEGLKELVDTDEVGNEEPDERTKQRFAAALVDQPPESPSWGPSKDKRQERLNWTTSTLASTSSRGVSLWSLLRYACFVGQTAPAALVCDWNSLHGYTVVVFRLLRNGNYQVQVLDTSTARASVVTGTAIQAIDHAFDLLSQHAKDWLPKEAPCLRVGLTPEPATPLFFLNWWRLACATKDLSFCTACSMVTASKSTVNACPQCGLLTARPFPAGKETQGWWCATDNTVQAEECAHDFCKDINQAHWYCTECWGRGILSENPSGERSCSGCKETFEGRLRSTSTPTCSDTPGACAWSTSSTTRRTTSTPLDAKTN